MWMLSWLPDAFLLYVVNTILVAGAISFFITFFAINRVMRWFPAIAPYYLILQIVSTVLLVAGIYFKGGYSVEMSWREKVADLENKIAVSEQQSKEANVQIKTVIKEKIKVVKEVQVVIQDRIVEKEKLIDKECKVAPEAVSILNDAAKPTRKGTVTIGPVEGGKK
jgi:preprotein translocase subunit SecF